MNEPDPGSFSYGEAAPTYANPYQDQMSSALDAIQNRGSYESQYGGDISSLLEGLQNQQPFSYDPKTDPQWGAYAKQYRREGQRATADTLGQAATMSGGIPSTAAMTAAGQAGDYYAARLSDKLPELAGQAYERHQGDFSNKLAILNELQRMDESDYQKFIDETGLDFDTLTALMSLSDQDYSRHQDRLGQYNTDKTFGYNQYLDSLDWDRDRETIDRTQKNYEGEQALAKGQYDKEMSLEKAILAAEQLGDTSLLRKLLGL